MIKYKYSGPKTKICPRGDFRTEKPQLVKTGRQGGGWTWIQGCDEFISGRWEGFVSLKNKGKVYSTKAEGLKNKPKW